MVGINAAIPAGNSVERGPLEGRYELDSPRKSSYVVPSGSGPKEGNLGPKATKGFSASYLASDGSAPEGIAGINDSEARNSCSNQ